MLHLVHPALVHLAIAFLVVGGIAEATGLLARREGWERFGSRLTLLGTASLVLTIASGFVAEFALDVPPAASTLLARHENVGLMLLAVFLGLLVVRAWGRGSVPDGVRVPYAVALLVGVALVVLTAYVGGTMVYGFGVGTAPVRHP